MPGPVFIEGEHVSLRTVEEEDVGFLQAQVNDARVRRPIGRVVAAQPRTGARVLRRGGV
jgi:hypothetical protein